VHDALASQLSLNQEHQAEQRHYHTTFLIAYEGLSHLPSRSPYHQLRSAIAQVGGKKQLSGKTDIDIEISNQCGRLIANAIIYYNSAILSRLLDKYQTTKNSKALALLKKISPVAWQHIGWQSYG
jgi:Tn3 transposase DDE domain-containing protein